MQIIDEADRMIDSMHQAWLPQVVKATYKTGSGQEALSIFSRFEPACVTAARLVWPLSIHPCLQSFVWCDVQNILFVSNLLLENWWWLGQNCDAAVSW